MGDSETARAEFQDRAVRVRVFYSLLALACLAVAAAHLLQAHYSYALNDADADGQPVSRPLRHGSFGSYLADLNPDSERPGYHPIVLLGNSVYQGCGIPERMQDLANARGEHIEFLNLAQTGSGIHDHFAQMLKALRARPELLVVAFINLAFTTQYAQTRLPRFRTDADQALFDPDVVRQVPASFLHREFTIATASESIVSTFFPFKRVDPIVRLDVDKWLYWRFVELLAWDPVVIRMLFHLPSFNLVQDWVVSGDLRARDTTPAQPYPELEAIVTEFLTVCAANGVPVLFLRQESSATLTPDVMPAIRRVSAAFPRVRVVDLQKEFRAQRYIDQVHPAPAERAAYAERHHDAILAAFHELTAPVPRTGGRK